uniref:Uncharacterized protein n=1 Tax=Arundo donax TaxID=35708 RepID=A0A0A9RGQ9_ARUDO
MLKCAVFLFRLLFHESCNRWCFMINSAGGAFVFRFLLFACLSLLDYLLR